MAMYDRNRSNPAEIAANPAYSEAMAAMPVDLVWKPLAEYRREDMALRDGSPGVVLSDRRLSDPERLLALLRLRERIASAPLAFEDSTEIGNKHTECDWGLCEETGLYPNPASHAWPLQYLEDGRLNPLNGGGFFAPKCPMDRRLTGDAPESMQGCFYTCRVFQAKRGERPDREEALRLCEVAIGKARERIAKAEGGRS